MENVLVILFIIWIFISMFIAIRIAINIDDESCMIIIGIKDYIYNLFIDKNLFGIILSIIMLIISIPALFLILILQLIEWLFEFLLWVWKLGNKSQEKNNEKSDDN